MTLLAGIGSFILNNDNQGLLNIKPGIDGTKINAEMTIDNRQDHPNSNEVADETTLNDRQSQ